MAVPDRRLESVPSEAVVEEVAGEETVDEEDLSEEEKGAKRLEAASKIVSELLAPIPPHEFMYGGKRGTLRYLKELFGSADEELKLGKGPYGFGDVYMAAFRVGDDESIRVSWYEVMNPAKKTGVFFDCHWSVNDPDEAYLETKELDELSEDAKVTATHERDKMSVNQKKHLKVVLKKFQNEHRMRNVAPALAIVAEVQ